MSLLHSFPAAVNSARFHCKHFLSVMRVHLKTLGCRLNEAELESWSRDFQSRGHRITDTLADAEMVVINTCAVTGEAVRKSRKLMRGVRRLNPTSKLVVSGCFASLDPTQNAQSLGVDLLVGNHEKDHLVEIASRELDLHSMPELATLPGENSLLASGRQRAFVKIQDGCRYQCTFCVVTLARGEEKADPLGILSARSIHFTSKAFRKPCSAGCIWAGTAATVAAIWENLSPAYLLRQICPDCAWVRSSPGIFPLISGPSFEIRV